MFDEPLSPAIPSVSLSVTSTSSGSALTGGANPKRGLLTNAGPNVAFFRLGVGAQTALATDTPILPYTAIMIDKESMTHIAAICAATQTATLYFTTGAD